MQCPVHHPEFAAGTAVPVGNFRFDMVRPRVAESIAQRLAGDAVNLVPHDRMQIPRRAFHHQTERRGVFDGQFVRPAPSPPAPDRS